MVKLKTPDYWRYDNRSLIRDKSKGELSKKEIKDHLKSLPDLSSNYVEIPIWTNDLVLPSQKLGKEKTDLPLTTSISEPETEDLSPKVPSQAGINPGEPGTNPPPESQEPTEPK